MLRIVYTLGAFLGLATLCSASAQGSEGFLPASFSGWNSQESASPAPANLQGVSDSGAILNEYGLVSSEMRNYSQGSRSLEIQLFRMKDPSGAYGLYSFLRAGDMEKSDLTEHSSMSREHALVLVGNLVLDARGKDLPRLKPDLKALVAQIGPHAEQGPYPFLWQHLPLEGLEHRSDRYVLGPSTLHRLLPIASGDWLGFSSGAEAEVARYRMNGRELTLLVADFPTPQIANRRLAELPDEFQVNTARQDDKRPVIYTRRHLTLLALVVNARSAEEANTLLDQIHSATEVTWNEPTFSLTDPNIGTIVVGIIVGTGVLCAFALVAGLAFGGVRLAVKRLLPGKVFDRSDQLQILQLGLSSKPIEAQDFYGLGNTPRN
jgi:hypothetical protein